MNNNNSDINTPPKADIHLTNKEEVRIYRLQLLEDNQIKILGKIDCLATRINEKCDKDISRLDKRVEALEKRANTIDNFANRLFWVAITEGVAIMGLIFIAWIGIK